MPGTARDPDLRVRTLSGDPWGLMSLFPHRRTRPGTSPGLLVEPPAAERVPPRLSLFDFDAVSLEEITDTDLATCRRFYTSHRTTWLHVQGTPDPGFLAALGEDFNLHPLALEDVLNRGQRTKAEPYDDQVFIVMHLLARNGEQGMHSEQVSLFLGETWLVTFHEGSVDPFEPVRRRLRGGGTGRIRSHGSDYLLYAMLDLLVDVAFPLLEQLGDEIEEMEEAVLHDPRPELLDRIHYVKRELLFMRRQVWPQREVLSALMRDDHRLVSAETRTFLRDCYDHTVQVMDLVESYREMSGSLLDVYLSSVSNRMNDVMKVLTIIATIFIPLSFVAGIYGMNFDSTASPWNMPELDAYYGYPILIGVLAAIAGGMLAWFKRRGWW